jgi:acetyltransferase-like isoleucine patch superfamily enzyme
MSSSIHPTAIVEDGAQLGAGTRVWHFAHVRKDARIGKGCIIGKGVYVDAGVTIGDFVKIQNNVSVYHGVTIGNGVFVGPHVCFTNDKLPRAVNPDGTPKSAADWVVAKTIVKDGVSIGANATIVAGITLGRWCMIGAGAVVTKSVPPYALMLGTPARVAGVVAPTGEIVSRDYKPGKYRTKDGRCTFEVPTSGD